MGPGCVSRGQSPVLRNGGICGTPQIWTPSFPPFLFSAGKKKEFARILRGTRPIKQQASTTTYRVCVSYVCNISPINRDPAMREKIPESTFWGFYV
jgi:hypothetical protein